jgi:hypothetical protein
MSEFKQKLKYLLSPKNSNEKIFNNLLSKVHKRIKTENIAKLIHPETDKKNKSYCPKHNHINTTSKIKKKLNLFIDKKAINKFSLQELKKSKSAKNIANIMRSFSINDIHEKNEIDLEKNYNFINRFKSANHIKNKNYSLNNNLNFLDKMMNSNPYRTFINNIKTQKSKNKMDSLICNTFFSYRENVNPNNNLSNNNSKFSKMNVINKALFNKNKNPKNIFRINNIFTVNISKSNFNRYNLLNNNKIKNNKLLKISLI